MKRIITLLFLLTLIISMFSVCAFAAEEEVAPTPESTTVFEEIYDQVLAHSDKILSALAFLASLFLAFAYKRGFLPLIRGGLNAISNAVGSLKDESERASEISREALAEANDKLAVAEQSLSELTEKLAVFEQELGNTKDMKTKTEEFRLVLETQSELLYEIFMSSSIPTYLKESVGEKMCAMKKALGASEDGCDE